MILVFMALGLSLALNIYLLRSKIKAAFKKVMEG